MKLYLADINKVSLNSVNQLDKNRREKCERLKLTDDKKRCIAGGLLINRFLNGAKISTNEFGKPVADNGKKFNISHSGQYVLFALSENEVGCDIQKTGYVKSTEMAKFIFCDEEIKLLKNSADKLKVFFDLWTKKESFLKCIGSGFHRSGKSADTSGNTFEENGQKYYFKTFSFSDYIITVCSDKDDFPSYIEFLDLLL